MNTGFDSTETIRSSGKLVWSAGRRAQPAPDRPQRLELRDVHVRRHLNGHAAPAAEAEYVLKKTENRILLNLSGLCPSTNGKDLKKRKSGILLGSAVLFLGVVAPTSEES